MTTGAEELLGYFERSEGDPHMARGAEMCRRWIALHAQGAAVSQGDVDAFLATLEAESSPGSGWQELGKVFRGWARERGFEA